MFPHGKMRISPRTNKRQILNEYVYFISISCFTLLSGMLLALVRWTISQVVVVVIHGIPPRSRNHLMCWRSSKPLDVRVYKEKKGRKNLNRVYFRVLFIAISRKQIAQ